MSHYYRPNLLRSYVTGIAFLLCISALLFRCSILPPSLLGSEIDKTQTFHVEFPKKIWQTWEQFPQDMDEELQRLSKTWTDLNRDYRYELLTSESATTYVRDHFKHQPQIIETFEKLDQPIFRADLIRYLTLLAEGGVYTDIDTDCSRPIRDWIPQELLNRSNVVFGIEIDSRGEEPRPDLKVPAGLCQWTLMSKPDHPVIQRIVDQVIERLIDVDKYENVTTLTYDIVMKTTGPRVFTAAVLDALSIRTSRLVTYQDLSKIDSPKLIGDVLILPVSAFASGQDHSGSKPWGNEEQLISHHWRGHQGWRAKIED